ncbi:hypothetical protein BH23CHL5_BH23CHL5_07630 [soil metagenome]
MPSLAELDYAMSQTGRFAPVVRQLGGGTITARGEGQPFRVLGNDAVVYRLENREFGPIALRCSLEDTVDTHSSSVYLALASATTQRLLGMDAGTPLVQRLAYFPEGIALRSAELRSFTVPIVATEWLQGPTLLRAADHACRTGHRDALRSLAEGWHRAVAALNSVRFIHGSLSADNILIDLERGLVLVDYDYASWPGMAAPPDDGIPVHYRHPHGKSGPLKSREAFSALAIYVSLRVLAVNPGLRQQFGQPATVRDGTLLFSQKDFANPRDSELIRALEPVEDPQVAGLIGVLIESARAPVEQTATIEEAIATVAQIQQRATKPTNRPFRSTESSGLLPEPLAQMEAGKSTKLDFDPEPTLLALKVALASRDTGTVVDLWPNFAGHPDAADLAIPSNAVIYRHVRALLDESLESGDPEQLSQTVEAARSLGVAIPARIVTALRRVRQAAALATRLTSAMADNDRKFLSDFYVIRDVLPVSLSSEIETAMLLAFQWSSLHEAIELDDDHLILRAATPELWSTTGYLSSAELERIQAARARMRWREEVRRALRDRDGLKARDLSESRPDRSDSLVSQTELGRLERLVNQHLALERLRAAMASRSDRDLVDAMNEVETAGALLPPELDWSGIRDVVDRLSIVASIRRAAAEPRDIARLGRLLPAARAAFEGTVPYLGSKFDFAELERDVQRETQRTRLLEAIAIGDAAGILHAADPDPYGVIPTLSDQDRGLVNRLVLGALRADPFKAGTVQRRPSPDQSAR